MAGRQNLREGSIVKINLENFLTYDAVEFNPGPNLNVIIGPNGTGKSSIVCAIALGLAAKTSVLGRAKDAQDFVKHGSSKAVIEIELHNCSGENWIIKREISRKENTSKWHLNGRASNMRTVEETVSRLNIQVGNLCQFLPQDRVAEFAKMTPIELLENTEKAVGGTEMFENHQRLKRARETGRDLELTHARDSETLEREKAQNTRLEQDVKNFQQRERHLKRIKMLQMKRPWVEYEEKRLEYCAVKTNKEKLENEVNEAHQRHAPLRAKLDAAKEQAQLFEPKKKKKDEEIRSHAKLAAEKAKDIENLDESLTDCRQEIVNKRKEEETRLQRINDLQEAVSSLEAELRELSNHDLQPQMDEVNGEIRELHQSITRVQQQGETQRAQYNVFKREMTGLMAQLKKLQDVSDQKLNVLRRRSRDAYNAVMWLREHTAEFNAKIHEPIMTVINVKDPAHAKYVETQIPNKEMFAFVCEDKEDMEKFMAEIRDKQGLRISAVLMPPKSSAQYQPPHPIHHYRQYGFFSYLRELFTCPEAVMRYLCVQYNVFKIPIGNKYTKDNVETVIEKCREFPQFYTEINKYTVKRSKYSGDMSTLTTETKIPTLLTVSVDHSVEQQLKRELKEKEEEVNESEGVYKDLQTQHNHLEVEINTLRRTKKDLSTRMNARTTLQGKISMKKSNIARLEGEGCDLEQEEEITRRKMKSITGNKVHLLREMKNHTKKCFVVSKEKVKLCIQAAQDVALAGKFEAQLRDQLHSVKQIENDLLQEKERLKESKVRARELLAVAKKATNTNTHEDLSQEVRTAFDTCPDSLEDIDSAIHEEQARADCTLPSSEHVVREYQQRKQEIDLLEEKVEKQKKELENHQSDLEDTKTRWLGPLQDLVSRINEQFGIFFSKMNCAGEVDLKCPENSEDYEKYGINIKVKFRASEPLRELTANYQSGGEKSVATVLYMMAIQQLTMCPFRCVDEINQGMDPTNERKVFELVVKTASQEDTSQYFLLTPKLLPDLKYGDKMTVMCVFNGQDMMNHRRWKINNFIHRRRQMLD